MQVRCLLSNEADEKALYLLGQRQVASLTADLSKVSDPTQTPDLASANGQIVASLAAFQRTIDEYAALSTAELVEEKREKAERRLERFREDYTSLRRQFTDVKAQQSTEQFTSDRALLFSGARPGGLPGAPTPVSRFARSGAPAESPFTLPARKPTTNGVNSSKGLFDQRTDRALREDDFLKSTGSMIDGYIAQGQAVLMNLGNQRDTLKGTQRSAANTLGLSRETIAFIERRAKGDQIILGVGAIVVFASFYFILRYFS